MMETYRITLFEGETPRKAVLPLPDNVAGDLLDYLAGNDFLRKNGEGTLRFVGTFQFKKDDYCLHGCVLPKYLNFGEERPEFSAASAAMVNIRRAIEKTGQLYADLAKFDPNQRHVRQAEVSQYELAKWLVGDYEKNGVFTIRERRQNRSGRGRTAWNRTILKTTPVIDNDEVAYLSPISIHVSRNDKVILSDIHRCAVKEAMDYLGEEAALTVEPLYREEFLGHLDQFTSVIRSFQRLVFTERDILLLRYLEAWCSHCSNFYNKPIGTVSFELVWEDVLRSVFGHKALHDKIGFGSPVYNICGQKYGLDGDSIPDVMNFWKTDSGYRFLLIDGKYYLGETNQHSHTAVKLPGYKDIAK